MIEVVAILTALASQVSAIYIPKWGTQNENDAYVGLWKVCTRAKGNNDIDVDICASLPAPHAEKFPDNYIYALRIITSISAISLLLALLSEISLEYKKIVIPYLIISIVCSIISTIIWLIKFKKLRLNRTEETVAPSISFVLNIVSAVICLGIILKKIYIK